MFSGGRNSNYQEDETGISNTWRAHQTNLLRCRSRHSHRKPKHNRPIRESRRNRANVTMTQSQSEHHGLSGGAIAGIVIGVLIALLILGLICFYCCIKGLLDGCLALFGLGGRRRRRTEVEEYERRTHHSSGGGGGRTWYGASKPSRVERRERRRDSGWGKRRWVWLEGWLDCGRFSV